MAIIKLTPSFREYAKGLIQLNWKDYSGSDKLDLSSIKGDTVVVSNGYTFSIDELVNKWYNRDKNHKIFSDLPELKIYMASETIDARTEDLKEMKTIYLNQRIVALSRLSAQYPELSSECSALSTRIKELIKGL